MIILFHMHYSMRYLGDILRKISQHDTENTTMNIQVAVFCLGCDTM